MLDLAQIAMWCLLKWWCHGILGFQILRPLEWMLKKHFIPKHIIKYLEMAKPVGDAPWMSPAYPNLSLQGFVGNMPCPFCLKASWEISRVTQGSSQTYWGSPIGSGTSTRERPGNLTSRALAWGNHWMIALTGYGPKRSEMKVNPTLNEGKCHMLRKCWSSSKTPVLGKLTFSTTFQYFCHE